MPKLKSLMERFLDDWRDDIAQPWRSLLYGIEPDLDAIDPALEAAEDEVVFPGRKGHEPPDAPVGSHVFRALDGILPPNVRAIVVGQDPYPRVSRATGRAFEQGDLESWASTTPRVALSLKRIIQQAASARTGDSVYTATPGGWAHVVKDVQSGALHLETPQQLFDHWQAQGVLFLNTGLTLTRYKQGGHPHQLNGHIPLWAPVVGAICSRLALRDDTPLVFLSWGSKARRFLFNAKIITSPSQPSAIEQSLPNTGIVDRSHPAVSSFLSGKNLFDEANEILGDLGANRISW